ncbi:MAG: hypothetical protein A2220_11100 [Ignavibacteria bacterium RIFOXYA2_FULL_35_10]|nr:MAG: hypothetical protein A2220_11100 [Ignavibacteria bacterium RIFOXYA2_FULL_35_10]
MPREINQAQPYQNKLVKLIPTEIVGAYMVLIGMIPAANTKLWYLIITIVLFVLTPFYLLRFTGVKNIIQLIVATLSFLVWTYSINGGLFNYWDLYNAPIASIILVLWTLLIPLVVKPT